MPNDSSPQCHVPKNYNLSRDYHPANDFNAFNEKIDAPHSSGFVSAFKHILGDIKFSKECEIFFDHEFQILNTRLKIKFITGYSQKDFRDKKICIRDLFLTKDIKRLSRYFQLVFKGRSFVDLDFQMISRSQRLTNVSVSLYPYKNNTGRFIGVRAQIKPRHNEQSRKQSLELLSSITEQISDSIIVTDLKFRIIFVNRATEKLYGYSQKELIGKEPGFLNAEPVREKIQRQIYRNVRKKNVWIGKHKNRRKDGSNFICEFKICAITDDQGKIYCYCSTQQDITEREESQRDIERQRDLGKVLSTTHALGEALNCILDAALTIKGFDCGGIYLVDEKTKDLDLAVHKGLCSSFVSKVSHFSQEKPQAQLVLSGRPFYGSYDDILKEQEDQNGKRREGLRSLAVIPISFDDRVIAALNLGSHKNDYIPVSLRAKVEAIASQIGGVLIRLKTEKSLEENFHFLQLIFETSPNPIFFKDSRGIYRSCNRAFASCFKKKEKDIIGKKIEAFAPKFFVELDQVKDQELIKEKKRQTYEARVILADGIAHDMIFFKAPSITPAGDIDGIVGFMLDITARKNMERESLRNAFHDSLTNIPNRRFFMKSLSQAINRSARNQRNQFGILFLDLDHFKDINDGLGHLSGDKIILDISRKLKKCLRANDTVARFGGDEFAILLDSINSIDDAIDAASRIQIMLARPIVVEGREFFVNASIGILLYSPEYRFPEEMLRDADIAMYRAKLAGRGRYAIFDETMHALALRRIQLEGDLRKAIKNNELKLLYQPIISLETGKMTCVEALIRWSHPKKGLISPQEFIPLAEEIGMISPITEWVLKTAAQQNKLWCSQGYSLRFSVNLSAPDLAQGNLSAVIEEILQKRNVDPQMVELELTETAAMKEFDIALSTLHRLNSLGIRVSIDDFGIGYSPLLYLKRFPVSKVKIDISFIRDIPRDSNDAAITKAIISMAHVLGINVVAEGVETYDQLLFLQQHQCNEMQGFLFSRPVEPERIEEYLKQEKCFFVKNG